MIFGKQPTEDEKTTKMRLTLEQRKSRDSKDLFNLNEPEDPNHLLEKIDMDEKQRQSIMCLKLQKENSGQSFFKLKSLDEDLGNKEKFNSGEKQSAFNDLTRCTSAYFRAENQMM